MINLKTCYNCHVFFKFWQRGWKNKKKEFMGEKRCLWEKRKMSCRLTGSIFIWVYWRWSFRWRFKSDQCGCNGCGCGDAGARRRAALSGSSLAGQVQYIMTLFLFGLTSGATVLTAQYWGKGSADNWEDFGSWNAGCGFCDCIILSGSADHARAAFANIYKWTWGD